MGKSNRWSDEIREQALDLYEQEGPRAVERQLGVPSSTARSWALAAGVEAPEPERTAAATRAASARWAERRMALADEAGQLAGEAFAASREAVAFRQANGARQFAITGAVAVDKADILAGIEQRPTVHHHLITLEEVEAELARLDGRAIDVDSWDSDEQRSIGAGDGE